MIEDTKKIAKLARIAITEEETTKLSKDLSAILDWVEELNEVDVSNTECATHPTHQKLILREDHVVLNNTVEELISNAPQTKFNMFVVPKMVE